MLRTVGRSNLVRLTALAPIIGSFILVNDEFASLVHAILLDGAKGGAHPAPLLGFLPIPRLHLTYIGLSLLGIGSIVFAMRCPEIVRRYESPQQWLESEQRFLVGSRLEREFRRLVDVYWAKSLPVHGGPVDDWSDEPRLARPSYGQERYDLLHNFIAELWETAGVDLVDQSSDTEAAQIIIPEGVEVDRYTRSTEADDEYVGRFRTGILGYPNTDAIVHLIWRAIPAERGYWMSLEKAAAAGFAEKIVYLRFQDFAYERPHSRAVTATMYGLGAVALAIPTLHTFVAIAASALR